jgi:hypothetical protein
MAQRAPLCSSRGARRVETSWPASGGCLERLQDDILRVLKPASLKTLIDERLNLGSGDLNGHGVTSSSL